MGIFPFCLPFCFNFLMGTHETVELTRKLLRVLLVSLSSSVGQECVLKRSAYILIYCDSRHLNKASITSKGGKVKAIKTTTLMGVPLLVLLVSFCSTAYSITGNFSPDSTPYTGIVMFFSDAARQHPI